MERASAQQRCVAAARACETWFFSRGYSRKLALLKLRYSSLPTHDRAIYTNLREAYCRWVASLLWTMALEIAVEVVQCLGRNFRRVLERSALDLGCETLHLRRSLGRPHMHLLRFRIDYCTIHACQSMAYLRACSFSDRSFAHFTQFRQAGQSVGRREMLLLLSLITATVSASPPPRA